MSKVISFSSGKGGVGKTSLVANLGVLCAQSGQRTLLIDGDWNLGKLGITLGVRPRWTIQHVLQGEASMRDAVLPVRPELSLLGAPSGALGFEEMDEAKRNQVYYELDGLAGHYDTVFFDHASGIHSSVLQFVAASHQHVIVTTAEPTSYTDAYAIMKLLSKRFGVREFGLIVTGTEDPAEAKRVIARFSDVARCHLGVRPSLLDIIPWEPKLAESIRRQQPFVERYPSHALTDRLTALLGRLLAVPLVPHHGLNFGYGLSQDFL
jgi:flagellar biosynthesis protein FlhG